MDMTELRLEVLKLAARDNASGGAAAVVESARKLWEFFDPSKEPSVSDGSGAATQS